MPSAGIVPDDELGYMIVDRFGDQAHCFRKYQRMMYWMPKFKNMNPWPIPWELPESRLELAKMALRRMAVDLENKLSVFEVSRNESPITAELGRWHNMILSAFFGCDPFPFRCNNIYLALYAQEQNLKCKMVILFKTKTQNSRNLCTIVNITGVENGLRCGLRLRCLDVETPQLAVCLIQTSDAEQQRLIPTPPPIPHFGRPRNLMQNLPTVNFVADTSNPIACFSPSDAQLPISPVLRMAKFTLTSRCAVVCVYVASDAHWLCFSPSDV